MQMPSTSIKTMEDATPKLLDITSFSVRVVVSSMVVWVEQTGSKR